MKNIKNISSKIIHIKGEAVMPDKSINVDDATAMVPAIKALVRGNMLIVSDVYEDKVEPVKVVAPEPVAQKQDEEVAPVEKQIEGQVTIEEVIAEPKEKAEPKPRRRKTAE